MRAIREAKVSGKLGTGEGKVGQGTLLPLRVQRFIEIWGDGTKRVMKNKAGKVSRDHSMVESGLDLEKWKATERSKLRSDMICFGILKSLLLKHKN